MSLVVDSYRFAAGGGTGPTSVDPLAWWDFSNGSSITIETGISQADDLTGNGRHLVQATGSQQPAHATDASIGGGVLTVAKFDGSDDTLATSANLGDAPATWFVVTVKPDSSGTDALARMNGHATYLNDGSLATWTGSSQGDWTASSGDWLDDHVHAFVRDASQASYYIDGTQKASATSQSSDISEPFRLGADGSGGGSAGNWWVGECLVYSGALTGTDRTDVETYLADKWGITL